MPNLLAGDSVLSAVLELLRGDAQLVALLALSPVDRSPAVYEAVAPREAPFDYLVVSGPSEVPANTLGRGFGAAVLVYLRASSRSSRAARVIASRTVALLDAPDSPLLVDAYGSPPVKAVSELVDAGPGYGEENRAEVIHHYPVVIRVTVHS